MTGEAFDPIDEVEEKIAVGKISREEVERARSLWREQLSDGIVMPNGERVIVSERDLYHILLDVRIRRRPERIERMLRHVFEIRTAQKGRRIGLSEWTEDGKRLCGHVILDEDRHTRTMHVTGARTLGKQLRQGELLWRRDE